MTNKTLTSLTFALSWLNRRLALYKPACLHFFVYLQPPPPPLCTHPLHLRDVRASSKHSLTAPNPPPMHSSEIDIGIDIEYRHRHRHIYLDMDMDMDMDMDIQIHVVNQGWGAGKFFFRLRLLTFFSSGSGSKEPKTPGSELLRLLTIG